MTWPSECAIRTNLDTLLAVETEFSIVQAHGIGALRVSFRITAKKLIGTDLQTEVTPFTTIAIQANPDFRGGCIHAVS
jgi:hypothetical protein